MIKEKNMTMYMIGWPEGWDDLDFSHDLFLAIDSLVTSSNSWGSDPSSSKPAASFTFSKFLRMKSRQNDFKSLAWNFKTNHQRLWSAGSVPNKTL